MKIIISLIVSSIVGFSSLALSCVPTFTMEVTHNILTPGVRELVAHEAGGRDHATVYITLTVSKNSVVNFDDMNLALVGSKKANGVKYVTLRVKGSGTHDIVVLDGERETARQRVTTKMMPTTRGC